MERSVIKWGIVALNLWGAYGALVCPCDPIFGCRLGYQLIAEVGSLALVLYGVRARWVPNALQPQ